MNEIHRQPIPDFKKQPLLPVIVQDIETKEVLMLAYANEESYVKMCQEKETWFYSRSRKALWNKGATSGQKQYIKEMYIDCDCDTLLVVVEQCGQGACHTGAYSCFYRRIDEEKKTKEEDV